MREMDGRLRNRDVRGALGLQGQIERLLGGRGIDVKPEEEKQIVLRKVDFKFLPDQF